MRIAILRSTSPSSISMKVYADNIVAGLKIARPGWDIVDLSPQITSSRRSSTRGNALHKYYQRYLHYPLVSRKHEADIFHIVDHSDGHLIPWLKRSGKTTVITCHDLINLVQPDLYHGLSLAPMISLNTWRWSVQRMKAADHIVTVSSHTASDVVKHLRADPTSVTTVPNAVSDSFQPLQSGEITAFRQQHGISSETFCLLNVGSNNPRKNVSAVLEVMRALRADQKPIHFWKAGSDFDVEQSQFIETHHLGEHVSYLGKLDDSELIKLYSAADALLAPSLYEGFGLTVLEAMASGTPVITSNTTSLPEVAGDAAILVDPNDIKAMVAGVSRLMQAPDFRQRLIEAGLSRVKTFTWVNTAKQIANVYEHVYQSTR